MIYKVTYQPDGSAVPRRENTRSLYLEAESEKEVRQLIKDHTPYLVEFIQPLDEAHLAYEKKSEDFKLTEFDD